MTQSINPFPKLQRTKDVAWANEVVNNPAVLPGLSLGLFETIDLAALVENPANHLFMGEYGGAILVANPDCPHDEADIHDFVLPEGRGKWAKEAASEIFEFAFVEVGLERVTTKTPIDNRGSCMFNRILGFVSEGVREVNVPGSEPIMMEHFVLRNPHMLKDAA